MQPNMKTETDLALLRAIKEHIKQENGDAKEVKVLSLSNETK